MSHDTYKLLKFRVTDFKSVKDSGWIETDEIATLIGTNEAGKSNVLVALWKLNPAMGGDIAPLSDLPRKRFSRLQDLPDKEKPIFITAHFLLPEILVEELAEITKAPLDNLRTASVSRRFDGERFVSFPDASQKREIDAKELKERLQTALDDIEVFSEAGKSEEGIKVSASATLREAIKTVEDQDYVGYDEVSHIQELLAAVDISKPLKSSEIVPRYKRVLDEIREAEERVTRPDPETFEEVTEKVLEHLPKFVYYSQYGNLDSDIFLPHVIENMNRPVKGSQAAKVRTLKVLFKFVNLDPQKIYELGNSGFEVIEPNGRRRKPTEEEIETAARDRKEREVRLQSASAELTDKFRQWWKQGEYRFRFQADGDYFKIWVSDDKRPEEIELEERSTGLQWFLSFYLIFLVESQDAHAGTILLLDEAGLSLHPLAQKDLAAFFESLGDKNQLIHSTHSPFLVDSNNLDRVTAVYVGEDGTTQTSPDLRAGNGNSPRDKSIYAVHAALGLTVSDVILQGCQPVIVEGTSDEYFLNGVKNYLIGEKLIAPAREIVFMPTYGVKGIPAVASVVAGKDEELPYVLVDGDSAGSAVRKKLEEHLYKGHAGRIIDLSKIRGLEDAEVEDLMPAELVADVVARYLKGPEEDFDEVYNSTMPLVPQVKAYAKDNNITLDPGWKVDVAKKVKARLLNKRKKDVPDQDTVERWKVLFDRLVNVGGAEENPATVSEQS